MTKQLPDRPKAPPVASMTPKQLLDRHAKAKAAYASAAAAVADAYVELHALELTLSNAHLGRLVSPSFTAQPVIPAHREALSGEAHRCLNEHITERVRKLHEAQLAEFHGVEA